MSESAHPQFSYHFTPATCCWLSAAAKMQCSLSPHQQPLIVMPVLHLLFVMYKIVRCVLDSAEFHLSVELDYQVSSSLSRNPGSFSIFRSNLVHQSWKLFSGTTS